MARKDDTDILADLEKKLASLEKTEKTLAAKQKELKDIEGKIAEAYASQMDAAEEVEELNKTLKRLKDEAQALTGKGAQDSVSERDVTVPPGMDVFDFDKGRFGVRLSPCCDVCQDRSTLLLPGVFIHIFAACSFFASCGAMLAAFRWPGYSLCKNVWRTRSLS